jgi:hypothetical protein
LTAAEKKAKEKEKSLALNPENLPGKLGEMMAEAKVLAFSGLVPVAYAGNPAAVCAIILYGKELGVGPMTALQNVAFINGRPSMGSELRSAVAHTHHQYAGMKVEISTDKKCVVKVGRRYPEDDFITWYEGSFTIEEAQVAGLLEGGPKSSWFKYRKRMLFHRACAFATMDAFPDVEPGMHTQEEMAPGSFAGFQEEFLRADDALIKEHLGDEGIPRQEDGVEDTAPQEGPVLAPKRGRKPGTKNAAKVVPMKNVTKSVPAKKVSKK